MTFDELAEGMLGEPGVSEGKMFGMRCLKAGSKVFAGLWEDDLTVKLSAQRVEELKRDGIGEAFEPMAGRTMKEWLRVPSRERWFELAREAHVFVAGSAR